MTKVAKQDHEGLGRELVHLIQERGLGAIPKRDLDALLLYLCEKHLGWASWTNQQLSIALRLPVPKIKALRYEGALRFTEDLDAEFAQRLRRLLRQAGFKGDERLVQFIIEDYATKFVLEEYVKKQGALAEWRFNDEGVSVPVDVVAALLGSQFRGRDRDDAIARLGIKDPESFDAAVAGFFKEIVAAGNETKIVKVAKLAGSLAPGAKQAKALWELLGA